MATRIRSIAGRPELAEAWLRAAALGFLRPFPGPGEMGRRLARQDFTRAVGVFDGDRCVATYQSFDQQLTVVGGGVVPANAVSAVSVTATHRRRGLLRELITADLAAARERGDVVATLVAAEYPIYGRFGFGPATSFASWRVNSVRTGMHPRWPPPGDGGSLAFVDTAEVRRLGPELHDRYRLGQPGAINRDRLWWELATGEVVFGPEWREPYFVLYRDAGGVPQGLAAFTVEERSDFGGQPTNAARVRGLTATSPAAERALWVLLLSLDWVSEVDTGRCPPDALLPHLLPDPRAAAPKRQADFLWVRPLDLPRMLAAREYATAGELVLDVRDAMGLAGGRVLLETDRAGTARCAPTTRDADLVLDTGALSMLYLGDVSAARLAALGALAEERPGAVARADLLLHTGRRPFCPDMF